MSERQKKTETFIIKIMNQQNSTWQGSVTWVDEQREQYFRSALELLKLIGNARTVHALQLQRSAVRQCYAAGVGNVAHNLLLVALHYITAARRRRRK